MEGEINGDEIEIKEKYNVKALYYEINYPEKKVEFEPVFKKWLESQKRERGEKGKAFYCRDCNLFFYFINEKEVKNAKEECINIGYICEYCGELIFDDSYCCTKGGIKDIIYSNLLNDHYDCKEENVNCLKLLPHLFYILLFMDITFALFMKKRKTTDSYIFYSFAKKESHITWIFIVIGVLLGFLHFIIFLIPNIILYIIYIIIILIRLYKKCQNLIY